MRHAGDVALLLHGGQRRWTDALLSEARGHLSGCLNAVELSIAFAMSDNWLARPVEALGPGYCRAAIERYPALLSPLLVDHLRQRAAAALSLRLTLIPPAILGEDAPSPASAAGPLGDALTALRLAVDPWFMPHPIDRPMRADLPAEAFCDLIWTAAALLVEGLAARMGVDSATASSVIGRAAETVIARHDEQVGPFARAAYAATLAGDAAEVAPVAGEAALRHDLLLLAAMGGRTAGIGLYQALALLIDGEQDDRAALVRLLRLDDAAYVALLDGLSPLLEVAADWQFSDLLSRYHALTPDLAVERLARWRGPAPLVDKLARIGWGTS
ncbi:hypothetical protein BH10PSE13_BH10PSE13_23600 [soil metagenome]